MKKLIIKNNMLKQPSVAALLHCILRKMLGKENKNKRLIYPKTIGQYKLISKVKKSNKYNNYGIGIYVDARGEKAFIKTWRGSVKNFLYYSLINEYNTTKIISEKINSRKIGKFKIPAPLGYFRTKNSLSVAFEYIDGKPLSKFSIRKQSRIIINDAILFLDKLSATLNKQDRKYLKKRDAFFYIFSLPVIFLQSFFLERESKKTIFYSLLKAYFYSISGLNRKLTLAHGDLSPDNILVRKRNFYILDCEHMKYTLFEYDLNYLSVRYRGTSLFWDILNKHKGFIKDNFICLYISIQFSVLVDPKTGKRPYFDYLKI